MIQSREVGSLPGYSEGLFYIQDDAARQAVMLSEPRAGKRILDACAAPGGKSIAAAMAGAEVLSCDVNEKRLQRCRENYTRLGLEISCEAADATENRDCWNGKFDAVLADVPCTGSGILRKHPEIRLKSESDLFNLLPLQRKILDNVANYVKPGGLLIYSTCSVLKEEDEDQVQSFLSRHPDFCCEHEFYRNWPQFGRNDGFFAAKLYKS